MLEISSLIITDELSWALNRTPDHDQRSWPSRWNLNGHVETSTEEPQAGTTELLVVGLARAVYEIDGRKSVLCVLGQSHTRHAEKKLNIGRCNTRTRKYGVIVIESVWKLCWIIMLWWFIRVMMISLHGVRCVWK